MDHTNQRRNERDENLRRLSKLTWRTAQLGGVAMAGIAILFSRHAAVASSTPARPAHAQPGLSLSDLLTGTGPVLARDFTCRTARHSGKCAKTAAPPHKSRPASAPAPAVPAAPAPAPPPAAPAPAPAPAAPVTHSGGSGGGG